MSYMNPSGQRSTSEVMQRSQSTPNVGIKRTQEQQQRPRRTKTSIDFLAVPPRHAIHREKCVDPFSLGGFFPSSPRRSDQDPSGWWREDGPEEGAEEFARELVMDSDSGLEGSQDALFGREDQPAEALIKREDKLGVLTVLTGGQPGWMDGTEEERLHSPYISDEACDDEALRLAYERRRRQLLDGGDGQIPEKANSLFYEREEEEEAAGWFGLMRGYEK